MRALVPALALLLCGCPPPAELARVGQVELSVRGLAGAFENTDPTRGELGPIVALEFALTSRDHPEGWRKVVAYPPPGGRPYAFEGDDAPPVGPGKRMRLHLVGYLLGDVPHSVGRSAPFDLEAGVEHHASLVLAPRDGFAPPAVAPLLPRALHTATALPDGRVLLVGGRTESAAGAQPVPPELFDPATGESCTACLAGALPADLEGHTASQLPGGDVLIAGGRAVGGAEQGTLWLYRSGTATFDVLAAQIRPRADHAALVDPGTGRVLLAGGQRGPAAVADTDRVDATGGGATVTEGPPLNRPRAHAAVAALQTGEALLCGGLGADGTPTDTADVWLPSEDRFAEPPAAVGGSGRPVMRSPRVGHAAATLPDGSILIWGGATAAGDAVGLPEVFSPLFAEPGGFLDVDVPQAAPALAGLSASRLETGEILLVGGDPDRPSVWRFSAASNPDVPTAQSYHGTVQAQTFLTAGRRADHRALALADGAVLLTGGTADGARLTPAADDQPITGAAELFVPCAVADRPCPAGLP